MPFRPTFIQSHSLRHLLTIVVAAGVLGLALLSSTVLSWQADRRLQDNFIHQGERITASLARQSRLSLIYRNSENAAEAIRSTLAFPDIVGVQLLAPDLRPVTAQGPAFQKVAYSALPAVDLKNVRNAFLEAEDAEAWYFFSPVFSDSAAQDSPFEMQARKDELLGYARVAQSKATLQQMSRDIFVINLTISLGFAVALLLVIRRLAGRISHPLETLADAMGHAERGESVTPVALTGPSDISAMSRAFNSMIVALQERERELRQSRDDAMRFAKLKAEFAATMSHEVRTPLNGVIGTLDMLKSAPLPNRQAQLVDLAWDSSQYLLDLVNNILDFSRLEAGKMEAEQIDFSLSPLIGNVIEMLRSQARAKQISLEWSMPPTLPPRLIGDPTRIRQLLVNLIGNAIKFTEQGSVMLVVTATANEHVRFEVRDTGIGIEPNLQSHLFDSFTQADTSTTRRYGGSGLGLSICKQLVQLMDGDIGVDSRLGQGSCFWFELPLPASTSLPQETPRTDRPTQTSYRILVVDDNRTNQVIAQGMLEMLGMDVGVADDGLEGVKQYEQGTWDAILMDCNMPRMDGFEATAEIRSLEEGTENRVPILAMTANTHPADLSKCLAAGMDDHLSKPLTLDALKSKLKRWLAWDVQTLPQKPTAGDDKAALNTSTLSNLREILGDSIAEAIRPFLEDMPVYLEGLELAAAESDTESLSRFAHAIKGSAGNLGAEALATTAREIEEKSKRGNLEGLTVLTDRLRAEYSDVLPQLRAELPAGQTVQVHDQNQNLPLVLIVDDDRSTRTSLYHALARSGFRVAEAVNGAEALLWLEDNAPDVVLMDAMMPVMDGFSACIKIKTSPRWKDIPVLMITALEDQPSVERAFAAGASDYIPKPLHLPVVDQRVRRTIEATRAERHARHLAVNDALTGLANRSGFNDQVNLALKRAAQHPERFAVLFLDLDRFKLVNDTLGHEMGDRVLNEVGIRIRRCVRTGDCVARQGGDEFTVLLSDISSTAAANVVAQKICRALSLPYEIDEQDVFVSASIGIAVYPEDGNDTSVLLRRADTAMHRAKRARSQIRFYESDMEAVVSTHLKLESDLRHAIEREELVVHYQPVVSAHGGAVVGVEALVRWQHPERGMISPDEFIPLAEETGLIIAIGEQVLNMACIQAKAWREAGATDLHVAVNLSARQMEQGIVTELVRNALERSGLPPSGLVLEITESVLMENAREVAATLQLLRQMGVRLSIDDFGTGYSSLSYLKRFPTDTLKIDRSFIQDMNRDPDATAIVTGIIALAHSLRLDVVAEGVETEAQRDELKRLGCNFLQGYLISRPRPAGDFDLAFLAG